MSDLTCPYCGHRYNPDDVVDPNTRYEEQCPKCDKYFAVTVDYDPIYSATKAPCMNGGEHSFKPVRHWPRLYPDWVRCEYCGKDRRGDLDGAVVRPLEEGA